LKRREEKMPVRIITVEREYGSGGAVIARRLAERLGWKIWDEELTAEIARVANVDTRVAARCDERRDPFLYRLFKIYARGSYERSLPLGESRVFDTDRMVEVLHKVIENVASRGNCVIVGRGSAYILRNRPDAFHTFVYAPVEEKIRRVMSLGKSLEEAKKLVEEIDAQRAEFIRHYFGAQWPARWLYNIMINSKFGDEVAVEMIFQHVAALETILSARGVQV
jgi:cytidylate kinase